MARSSDRDFWKSQFEKGGNLAHSWFLSAFALLTAADVLDGFSGDFRGEILQAMRSGRKDELKMTRRRAERMEVDKVSRMLRAMATECLLKALWLKHGGILAKDGRYVGVLKKKERRLDELAKAVSRKSQVIFTERELELSKEVADGTTACSGVLLKLVRIRQGYLSASVTSASFQL